MSTFYDRFLDCVRRWPGNIALQIQFNDRIESCTYAELRTMAESVGQWIQESNYPPGSRLAIVADNHPRWVAAYLGIIAAGGAAVPLDTSLHADQLAKLLRDSGSSVVFCDAKHVGVCQTAIAGVAIAIALMDPERIETSVTQPQWTATLPDIFAGGSGNFQPATPTEDDLASLLYTSGTTADPKGVMLSQGNLLAEVEAVFNWVDIGPDDALLGVLPMFHVLALMANLMLPLVKGARVCYLETLNTSQLLRALQERGITTFAVVPQFFNLIHERIFQEAAKRGAIAQQIFRVLMAVNRALRKVGWNTGPILFRKVHSLFGAKMRYLVTGGSRFDPAIATDFYAMGIDILQAYGLTETTAAVFANSAAKNVIGSVGKALKGVEAKIVDPKPQDDGGPASGEVALRGGVVMKGYWKRPDATAAVLRDGWFYTGDLGYFDEDRNLFLTGRAKEVIVLSNGKNIYPEEVEAHYVQSPYIKEIAVIGIEGKAGEGGDRLHAVIVPNFDVLRQRKIVNAKEVIRFDIEGLSQQIASTKRIGSYEIWQEDLPRTTTRKIKRFEIEKRVRTKAGSSEGAASAREATEPPLTEDEANWLQSPEVDRALKVIHEIAHDAPPQIRPNHNLELDLGLDSMQRIELLNQVQQQLGGNVAESQLAGVYTVRDLVDAVVESAASAPHKAAQAHAFAGWKTIFAETPDPREVSALALPHRFSAEFLYLISRLIQVIALDRFHLHVKRIEKLPKQGAYILCSNHQSYLDAPILASVLPGAAFRKVFAVGTSEVFNGSFMARLARSVRVVVVDPDANLVPAMRANAFGLKQGRPLILYPEGERSIDGTPKKFKKGAAILSIHLQVPIVPVAIEGFYEAWPRNQRFRGSSRLVIEFGDPIVPPPEAEASEEAYEHLTADLRRRVVSMWQGLRAKQHSRA